MEGCNLLKKYPILIVKFQPRQIPHDPATV